MTAVEASSADVELRARATGFVRARVRALGGRRVIEVDARGERNAGALVRSDGQSIAAGARAAREQRLPLLIRIASSGADAGEGVSALDGWAGAAKEITANSGVVPSIAIVSGPTVSGPALMLGLVDHYYRASGGAPAFIGPGVDSVYGKAVWAIAALYVCGAGLRLARFNAETDSPDEDSHQFFRGLPTPGAAGAVASLIVLQQHLLQLKLK